MTVPNVLTLLRLLLVPCFLFASFRSMYTEAFVIFVTAAMTDVLDGFIARRFNQRSRLGAILDPAADKSLMVGGYLFYTLRGPLPVVNLPGWLTFVVFVRDILIVLFAYLLYTRVNVKRFPPSWAGKTSTVLQAVTLATTVAVNAFLPALAGPLEVLFRITLGVTLYSSWDYILRGKRLLFEGLAAS
ncbi:MAG TPA: CDP-alcohol phosphatidyltransferase family protein [Thermoanaerobaculia bacterium]|nr:CDP-alcohol phosphatidyltransferase family protein [Thermoanaerobaculia bacterium]